MATPEEQDSRYRNVKVRVTEVQRFYEDFEIVWVVHATGSNLPHIRRILPWKTTSCGVVGVVSRN